MRASDSRRRHGRRVEQIWQLLRKPAIAALHIERDHAGKTATLPYIDTHTLMPNPSNSISSMGTALMDLTG